MRQARFTEEAKENRYTLHDYNIVTEVPGDEEDMQQYANNKLGRHEDIEDKLDIDLITLFKALENGVYVKPWNSIKFDEDVSVVSVYTQNPGEKANKKLVLFDSLQNDYAFKDYGKTWALTKEELE